MDSFCTINDWSWAKRASFRIVRSLEWRHREKLRTKMICWRAMKALEEKDS